MKFSRLNTIYALFLLPLNSIGQNYQSNPPTQQQVNPNGGANLDNNPQAQDNNIGNNEFVIHEVIQQSNVTKNELFDQQNINSSNGNKQIFIPSSSGGSIGGGLKKSVVLRRSKLKVRNKFHKWFHRSPKKKRSSASCFSWT